jgi:hypothetical protein
MSIFAIGGFFNALPPGKPRNAMDLWLLEQTWWQPLSVFIKPAFLISRSPFRRLKPRKAAARILTAIPVTQILPDRCAIFTCLKIIRENIVIESVLILEFKFTRLAPAPFLRLSFSARILAITTTGSSLAAPTTTAATFRGVEVFARPF